MIDDDARSVRLAPIRVCKQCKVDVTYRGYRICAACLEKRSAAKARNPEVRARLVVYFQKHGTLYPRTRNEPIE